MRVPLSWLREIVDVELTPEALAARLTMLGMEVKAIVAWGDDWRNVVVGELLSVERHPRADRLSLTRVTVGDGEPLDIVCGATNIAAGQRVPVALPGAVLPGDRRIERTEKMGVVSNGMLCSGDELGLTADGDGILILPADAPLGRPLAELYGDTILDVDVKPNRGDALSIVGLAREVAAVTGGQLRLPPTDLVEVRAGPPPSASQVEVLDTDLCPRFVGRWVSGVRVGPSPDRIQMRLLAAGQRPVSNVVDVSNYVMLELGKPIHTFDAAAVHDGRIVVRRAAAGERLETLDHVARELDPETLVIADPQGPIGIAGVMGGASSEVTDATTEVIVESAIFDPISVRRTAFRYALRSEASLRFEKGQESRLARVGADRAARLIAEWAGGEVAPGAVDTDPVEPAAAHVTFRPARVNRLLGTDLGVEEQRALLARVGIETAPAAAGARITIAGGTQPLSTAPDAADVVLDATVPVVAAGPGGRGGHHRGGHPGPRLRSRPGGHPAHPDAALSARPAGRPDRRPRDARRGRPVRGRDLRARRAADRRAVPAARRRRPRRRARAASGGPADHRDQPALEPALDAPSDPDGEPARDRLDQSPPGA